jgi:dihydrofolate reductase
MTQVSFEISVSMDGYVAGPHPTLDDPLGEGGEQLHEWVVGLRSWREPHGREGGETGPEDDAFRERVERIGATVMGRKMYSGGAGPWEDDPNAGGWWGDDPPFHHPVFVVTHHARDDRPMEGGTTFSFVTEGVEAAVRRAVEAAGGKDVAIGGGADVAQQCLRAGLLDEICLHVAPVFLGGGTRLFEGIPAGQARLSSGTVSESSGVAHLIYSVAR